MKLQESQTVELKEAWGDEFLKTVCAFANTNGGTLYIGVSDNGNIIGVEDIKKTMEDLPNKVMSYLAVIVDVNIEEDCGTQYIKMTVPKSGAMLSYRGRFYIRSGSTTQELKGGELQNLLLKTHNLSWDKVGIDEADYGDINNETVSDFVAKATRHNRLPLGIDRGNVRQLFQNLKLLTADGKLTRAAVLLFGQDPVRFFSCATFKIGRFKGTSPTDLMFDDKINGNLFTMFDEAVNFLKSRYLISPISYQGMRRVETLEIPDEAIREAILNAIIHKDYTSTASISLRVYDPTVSIWNSGELEKLTLRDLSKPHDSIPRNPLIADMFYRAGYIEAWGRGTLTIIEETMKRGLPKPTFKLRQGGLEVIFQRNTKLFSGDLAKTPYETSPRQQKAVDYVKENGSINNKAYQELTGVSKRTATNDLTALSQNMIFEKIGSSGESVRYVLMEQ